MGKFDTAAIETIPVAFNDIDNSIGNERLSVKADDKVLGEFRQVALRFPDMDVGMDANEGLGCMAEGSTKLLEFEHTLINVVAMVHATAKIDRLGAPNLGRDFDHESAGWRRDGCSIRDGGRIDELAARMEQKAGISVIAGGWHQGWKAGISVVGRIGGCKRERTSAGEKQAKQTEQRKAERKRNSGKWRGKTS
jgi:hypothetical protein